MSEANKHGLLASQTGQWPLYISNPDLKTMIIQSKTNKELDEYLTKENRFSSLQRLLPEEAERLFSLAKKDNLLKEKTLRKRKEIM